MSSKMIERPHTNEGQCSFRSARLVLDARPSGKKSDPRPMGRPIDLDVRVYRRVRRYPRRMRLVGGACLLAGLVLACTATDAGLGFPASGHRDSQGAHRVIRVSGRTYERLCEPVPETLIDVQLSKPSSWPIVHAVAGLWSHQAVAVSAKARPECGLWTLAIDPGLTPATRAAIQAEMRRGVAAFGVTAAPIPKDPDNGMDR